MGTGTCRPPRRRARKKIPNGKHNNCYPMVAAASICYDRVARVRFEHNNIIMITTARKVTKRGRARALERVVCAHATGAGAGLNIIIIIFSTAYTVFDGEHNNNNIIIICVKFLNFESYNIHIKSYIEVGFCRRNNNIILF